MREKIKSITNLFFLVVLCNSGIILSKCLEQNGGLWFCVKSSGTFSRVPKTKYFVEFHTRFKYTNSFYDKNILRFSSGYLYNHCSLWLGYDFIPSKSDEKNIFEKEQRFWQQAIFKIKMKRDHSLCFRTRLEERFKKDKHNPALRLRQKFFAQIKKVTKKTNICISNELFFNLNPPNWVGKRTFKENRLEGGLEFLFAKKVRFFIGYLNQVIPKEKNTKMNHILTMHFHYRW